MLFTPLLQGGASSGSTTTKLVCVNSTRKYNRQPQVTAQIDPYWKARGFKWVVNGTQPRELISGDILSPTAGATTEVNQSGKALANRSTGVGWTKSITSSPSQAATLVWFGDFYASSTIDPFLAGIIPNLTDSAPYSNVALIRNRTGFGAGSIGFFYADATNTLKIDCSPNFVYNTTKNLGIVAKIRNGSQKLFTNIRGLEKETTYILGGGGLRTATPILVVGSGHVGRSADASCSLFAVSDQFLTDEECLSLAKNPWQIFKAPSQSLYLASVNSTVFTNTIDVPILTNSVSLIVPTVAEAVVLTLTNKKLVRISPRPQRTQPQVAPKLLPQYANWEWVYTPSSGTRNLGFKGIDGVFTGSAGYDSSFKSGKSYKLGFTNTSGLRLGDTTCKFTQTKPVSGLIVFRPTFGSTNTALFNASSVNVAGLYVKVAAGNNIEIDTASTVLLLAGSNNEVKINEVNTVAFCIEPRVADGGTGRISYAINGKLVTGTWTATPVFTNYSVFGMNTGGAEGNTHQQMLSCATTTSISNAELVKLSNNPWGIFKPANQPFYLSPTKYLVPVQRKKLTHQPKTNKIDRSNPITLGLVKAINAGAADPTVTLAGSSPSKLFVTSPVGVGYSANGAASYWQASPTALASLNPTWTILTIVSNFTGSTGGGGYGLYVERPNATQIVKICVGMNATSSNAEFTIRDLSNNLVQMRPSYTTSFGPNVSDGKPHVMIFTRRASNNHRGWIDGVERVANTVTNISGSFAATNATIGIDLQDQVIFNGSVPLVLVWNRSLSDAELLSISQNPWQVFKASNQPLYLSSVAVSAPTTPTLETPLLSNNNSYYNPTITTGAITVTASLYTNTVTQYIPTVTTAAFTVSPTLFTNTNNYYSPTVGVGVVNITNSVLPSTTSFFVATVSTGPITLLDPLYTNSNTLVAPTVTTGVVLLSATLYSNATILYTAIVANYVWQASIIIFLSGLRTKVFNTLNKSMLLLSSTRTKIFTMGIKTLSLTSATRTKVFIPANKSISLTSATRTYTFVVGIKTKIFPTSTRG